MTLKQKHTISKTSALRLIAIGGLATLTVFAFYQQAQAGPITGGAGNAPFVKLGVYQGVMSIVPGGATDSIMEIGNAGRDIKTTGDLNFFPGTGENVHVQTGSLCFGNSTSTDCRNTWAGIGASTLDQVLQAGNTGNAKTIILQNQAQSVRSLELASGAGAVANAPAGTNYIFLAPNMFNGAFSSLTQANDSGLFFGNSSGFVIAPWATNTEGIRIASNGYVGIGATSPNEKLEVSGNIRINNNYLYGRHDVVGTVVRTTRTDSTQPGLLRSNGWGDFTYDRSVGIGYDLAGASAGVGNLLVAGKIGIGTTSTGAKLTVNNPATSGKVGATGDGIYAYANSTNAAISGEQANPAGWAGYFSGRVNVTSFYINDRLKPQSIEVCQVGTDTCLGKYSHTLNVGDRANEQVCYARDSCTNPYFTNYSRDCYNPISDGDTASAPFVCRALYTVGAPVQSCPRDHSLRISGGTSGTSYFTTSTCTGTEYRVRIPATGTLTNPYRASGGNVCIEEDAPGRPPSSQPGLTFGWVKNTRTGGVCGAISPAAECGGLNPCNLAEYYTVADFQMKNTYTQNYELR